MEILSWIVAACTMNVCVISLFLIFHPDYEDGFWGRVALTMLGTSAGIRFIEIAATGFAYRAFSSVALLVWAGLAIFFWRHLVVFLQHRGTPRVQCKSLTIVGRE